MKKAFALIFFLPAICLAQNFSLSNFQPIDETVFTWHIRADPNFVDGMTASFYAGYSQAAPCSDLRYVGGEHLNSVSMHTASSHMSSDDLGIGAQGKTCMSISYVMDKSGHTYSTGNIKLTYDQNTHMYSAIPKEVSTDWSQD